MATRLLERPHVATNPAHEPSAWRYVYNGGRDVRLDLMRGVFVVAMVVDHLGGASWFHVITGGNRFFVSAAEGFVLVSGLVMGLVYGKLIARDGFAAAAGRAVRRAGFLYVCSVALSVAFYVASSVSGASWAEPLAALPTVTIQTATLQRSNYLSDVLTLYALLVLAAPIAFALLTRKHTLALLTGSTMLWGAHQLGWTRPIDGLLGGGEYFAPIAWQLIFTAGLALGFHWRGINASLEQAKLGPWLLGLATVAAGLIVLAAWAPHSVLAEHVAAIFAKEGLRAGRIFSTLIFMPMLFGLMTLWWRPVNGSLGWLLAPLGRGALLAYSLHLFLAVAANVWWVNIPGYDLDEPVSNTLAHVLVIGLLWLLVQAPWSSVSLGHFHRIWAKGSTAGLTSLSGWRRLAFAGTVASITAGILTLGSMPWLAGAPGELPGGVVAAPQANVSTISPDTTTPRRAPAVPTYIARRAERAATAAAESARTAPDRIAVDRLVRATQSPHAVPVAASAVASERLFHSDALGRDMAYWILLPPGYERDSLRYPVLYLLHGMGGDRGEWIEYGAFDAANRLQATGAIQPLIIVLPQGDQSYWVDHVDGSRWGEYVAKDLVNHIDLTYRTQAKASSRAIGGLSMGGTGALTLALTYAERFGAVGMHSPSIRSIDTSLPIFGSDEDFALRDPLALIRSRAVPLDLKLWVDIGAEDGWLGAATSVHDVLDEQGVPHHWHVSAGTHDGSYWSEHIRDYLRFYGEALTSTRERS